MATRRPSPASLADEFGTAAGFLKHARHATAERAGYAGAQRPVRVSSLTRRVMRCCEIDERKPTEGSAWFHFIEIAAKAKR